MDPCICKQINVLTFRHAHVAYVLRFWVFSFLGKLKTPSTTGLMGFDESSILRCVCLSVLSDVSLLLWWHMVDLQYDGCIYKPCATCPNVFTDHRNFRRRPAIAWNGCLSGSEAQINQTYVDCSGSSLPEWSRTTALSFVMIACDQLTRRSREIVRYRVLFAYSYNWSESWQLTTAKDEHFARVLGPKLSFQICMSR